MYQIFLDTLILIIVILIILIIITNLSNWIFNCQKNYTAILNRHCNTSCKECMPKECKKLFNIYQKSKINEIYFLMVCGILLCFCTLTNKNLNCKNIIYSFGFSGTILFICSLINYMQIKNDYIN